jgi:predicted ArsR family transcriptional regulator
VSSGQASNELPAEAAIRALSALEDPLRRSMFQFIRAERRWVSRAQAAEAVGISTKLAAFHLDKLVAVGLLRCEYHRINGERKVGRTPKVYSPVDANLQVSIPERRLDLLAGILIHAVVGERADETARQAAIRAARDQGRSMAEAERLQLRPGRLGAERALTVSQGVLERLGYEPDRVSPNSTALQNCPFDPLARQESDLVCGLNQAFLAGFLAGLNAPIEAVLEPRPGYCCVELRG